MALSYADGLSGIAIWRRFISGDPVHRPDQGRLVGLASLSSTAPAFWQTRPRPSQAKGSAAFAMGDAFTETTGRTAWSIPITTSRGGKSRGSRTASGGGGAPRTPAPGCPRSPVGSKHAEDLFGARALHP